MKLLSLLFVLLSIYFSYLNFSGQIPPSSFTCGLFWVIIGIQHLSNFLKLKDM